MNRIPIALSDTIRGTYNLGGSFKKSLNMFLDYNRFSANVMGLLYEPLISLYADNRRIGVLAEWGEVAEDDILPSN